MSYGEETNKSLDSDNRVVEEKSIEDKKEIKNLFFNLKKEIEDLREENKELKSKINDLEDDFEFEKELLIDDIDTAKEDLKRITKQVKENTEIIREEALFNPESYINFVPSSKTELRACILFKKFFDYQKLHINSRKAKQLINKKIDKTNNISKKYNFIKSKESLKIDHNTQALRVMKKISKLSRGKEILGRCKYKSKNRSKEKVLEKTFKKRGF